MFLLHLVVALLLLPVVFGGVVIVYAVAAALVRHAARKLVAPLSALLRRPARPASARRLLSP